MGSSYAITYDSIVMFSLCRYLDIGYPENLHQFFLATENFKMSVDLVSGQKQPNEESNHDARSINFFGHPFKIYGQASRPKFALYDKSSSFLQNGLSIIVNIISCFLLSKAMLIVCSYISVKLRIRSSEFMRAAKTPQNGQNVSFSNRSHTLIVLQQLFNIWLLILSLVCEGLPIKQLTSNLVLFLLSIFLQADHMDQMYQINI